MTSPFDARRRRNKSDRNSVCFSMFLRVFARRGIQKAVLAKESPLIASPNEATQLQTPTRKNIKTAFDLFLCFSSVFAGTRLHLLYMVVAGLIAPLFWVFSSAKTVRKNTIECT